MFLYGQTEAAAYLGNDNARITGYALEQPAGQVLVSMLLAIAIFIATIMLRDRLPVSKEQAWAMQPVDWSVSITSLLLWLYAASALALHTAMKTETMNQRTICLCNHLFSTSLVGIMLFVFLFITIETVRKINYASTRRMHCLEYKMGIAFLVLHIPLGVLALFRFSSTPRGNTCAVGLPRDILLPLQIAIAVHNVYAAIRICWPLLRIKHETIRAWGVRTMIGVFLCAVAGSMTFLILSEISAAYMYYTEILCLLLAAMMLASIAAFIMTLNPAYKNFSKVSRSTPGEEAHVPATGVQGHNCSNCRLPFDSAILVSGQDVQTLNSTYSPGRYKKKTFSVLDSKSVAEFLFDEDCSVPAPAFPGDEQSPAEVSSGLTAMVPLQMMSWSYLRASEGMKWSSGRLTHGTKQRTQPYPLLSTQLARPKDTSSCSNNELCPTDLLKTRLAACPHESNAGAVETAVSLTGSDPAAQLDSGTDSQFTSPQSSVALGNAQTVQLPDLSSQAMRAAFLDAPAIQGPTSLSKVGIGSRQR